MAVGVLYWAYPEDKDMVIDPPPEDIDGCGGKTGGTTELLVIIVDRGRLGAWKKRKKISKELRKFFIPKTKFLPVSTYMTDATYVVCVFGNHVLLVVCKDGIPL